MSHFCVLVIGSDVEEQLAKYDENESVEEYRRGDVTDKEMIDLILYYGCGNVGNRYKVGQDFYYDTDTAFREKVLSEYKQRTGKDNPMLGDKDALSQFYFDVTILYPDKFVEWFKTNHKNVFDHFEDYYKEHGEDWNSNRWRKDEDGVWAEYSEYNPDSKWDWWCQGGRFRGRLKLKEPNEDAPLYTGWQYDDNDKKEYECLKKEGYCDQALAGDVSNLDEFVPFAIVKDGEWYERGEMGWWCCVSNEKAEEDWDAEVKALLKNLPGDTLLTVIDCHI